MQKIFKFPLIILKNKYLGIFLSQNTGSSCATEWAHNLVSKIARKPQDIQCYFLETKKTKILTMYPWGKLEYFT